MIKTDVVGQALASHGFTFFSGVPCSFLKSLINYAINSCHYISATNEGDAVATCAGAALGGQKSVMLMQNSGLGNAVSPLTSLIHTFKIPILLFVSLRGEPGIQDEPQHELMGTITQSLLETMGIAYEILDANTAKALEQINTANSVIESGKPFCFIVKKNTFESHALERSQTPISHDACYQTPVQHEPVGSRTEALTHICQAKPDTSVVLATTGKTGRELFEIQDDPNHFYQVGSMGCISAIGLGMALSRPLVPMIVIDGDGAALMRLGSWATNGYYSPPNMCHIVLDNEVHDSTGGQDTLSKAVNFSACAASMNYPRVISVSSLSDLSDHISQWVASPILTFIHVKIFPGSPKNLGRPTITPEKVAKRLFSFLN